MLQARASVNVRNYTNGQANSPAIDVIPIILTRDITVAKYTLCDILSVPALLCRPGLSPRPGRPILPIRPFLFCVSLRTKPAAYFCELRPPAYCVLTQQVDPC